MVSEKATAVTLPVLGSLTYREIHAVEDGLYCGYVGRTDSDYEKESHYWRTGYLVGNLVLRRFKTNV